MIVQHMVTGEILQAIRMPGPFWFQGAAHPAGDVLVLRKAFRQVVPRARFDVLYTELPTDDAGCIPDPAEEVTR